VIRLRAWILVVTIALVTWPPVAWSQDAGTEAGAGQEQVQQTELPTADEAQGSALTDPEEEALDAQAAEIAAGLRCPVCRNQSIVESNAELSREMHAVVRDKLAAGETQEQIEAYFVSRYGEWILLRPQARGINLLVYGLPLVALVLGFFLARNRLRKWASVGEAQAAVAGTADLDAEDEQWLREALRES
jgi:cytochrome c-type biogenesis protein CcmH